MTARIQFGPGSSPLARGLPRREIVQAIAARIIPARAGFTSGNGMMVEAPTDHPRSRGVYLTATILKEWWDGSSPLARGLRPR